MTIHFACTMCGKCCHDLRLPLAVDEAIDWLTPGGDVQILCDAIPWPSEPPANDALAQHRRRRSFAARSGALPLRVTVTLVAAFAGACPHLRADMSCGAYESRPRVCRIYPAELNPSHALDPSMKACPPEAWAVDGPLLLRAGRIVDHDTAALIAQSRSADVLDRQAKILVCVMLGIRSAALANEGFAVYSPPRERLLQALQASAFDGLTDDLASALSPFSWHLVTNRSASLTTLRSLNAHASAVTEAEATANHTYHGFFEDDICAPSPGADRSAV